ncbi:NAD-dependent epimerase/dehydratase family protein [Christensenella tenuis]|uniref:NAD(P)-dependent oxidoreductase n=1 Tax=Christensenella tenuis TaxID=2763033 RepID=A0ABR7EDK2_9FIRM|nr:NAD(P)-dependent oxidoreductase [Christensenella tenuis]MBC5647860.1 NAD(P)-dependent oxidoreductase [Christensenella tenuis]
MNDRKAAVVTGASGFLGNNMVRKLLQEDFLVYAIIRPQSPRKWRMPNNKDLIVVEADADDIMKIIPKVPSADIFYHFAWKGGNNEARKNIGLQLVNVENSLRSLETAIEIGCSSFVFAGSQAEYGTRNDKLCEGDMCAPVSPYGKAKLEMWERASELAEKKCLQYTHARLFSVYGTGDNPATLIPSCITHFLNKKKMPLTSCQQIWNFLYIEDAINALFELGKIRDQVSRTQIYNVASKDTRVLRDFIQEIFRLTGRQGEPVYGSYPANAEGLASIIPSTEKIEKELAWKAEISFEEGIKRMIEEYKRSGNI